MVWIFRILFGHLKVRFSGDRKEKILSLCASSGISLWNSKFTDDGIESNILVRDFRYIRKVAFTKGTRVHILQKKGVPFITERYKKRFGIPIGIVIFFAIIYIMSGYIWIVDVEGNHKVKSDEILALCQKIGVEEGIKRNSIYPKLKREKLLQMSDELAWASLNMEGCRLTVSVTEVKEPAKQKKYSNLKASADGVIERIDIVSGTSVVKVSDAVKKGDLLVSGIVETKDTTRFVNSKGTVIAKTEREIVLEEMFTQKIKVPSGEVANKSVLSVFGLKIPIYLGKEKGNYEESLKTEALKLFGQTLPIKIHKKRFEFYNEKKIEFSYEELCKRLEARLEKEIKNIKCEEYEIVEKEFIHNGDRVTLIARITARENIADEDILLISAGNS